MNSRFEIRPQRHSTDYPYDVGHAIFDKVERRQTGWYQNGGRASARCAELNSAAVVDGFLATFPKTVHPMRQDPTTRNVTAEQSTAASEPAAAALLG